MCTQLWCVIMQLHLEVACSVDIDKNEKYDYEKLKSRFSKRGF